MASASSILWFRQDLRLADNPALQGAVRHGGPLVCLYVLDERIGGAQRWWLHRALAALDDSLRERGNKLVLRRGDPAETIDRLAGEIGANAVFWNRCYEPAAIARDLALKERLKRRGLAVTSENGSLLVEPWELKTGAGGAFRVFTPFWRALSGAYEHRAPMPTPRQLPAAPKASSEALDAWHLLPSKPNWARGFAEAWTPGEAGAQRRLAAFLQDGLDGYEQGRERPEIEGTSRLSPHLHWGELSPRQLWHAVRHRAEAKGGDAAPEKFLSELGWREFSYHLLFHYPDLPEQNWRETFDAFPWRRDTGGLRAWQQGLTGYPIVDAGMRQLWQSGWMHNRVRMVAASFLVKDLLIDWRKGAAWFWDTLVDADLANNSASWQWVAGSGADAAPYFRIFNPVLQGERFDPAGDYVRRWVPELRGLPDKWVHRPWQAPAAALDKAGVRLDQDYPRPIVDHAAARQRALAAFAATRQSA